MRLSSKLLYFICLLVGDGGKNKKMRRERKKKKKNGFRPRLCYTTTQSFEWVTGLCTPSTVTASGRLHAHTTCVIYLGKWTLWDTCQIPLCLLLQWKQYFQVRRQLQLQNWQLKFYFNIFSLCQQLFLLCRCFMHTPLFAPRLWEKNGFIHCCVK